MGPNTLFRSRERAEHGTARVDKENLVRPVDFHFFQQAARLGVRSRTWKLEEFRSGSEIKKKERAGKRGKEGKSETSCLSLVKRIYIIS